LLVFSTVFREHIRYGQVPVSRLQPPNDPSSTALCRQPSHRAPQWFLIYSLIIVLYLVHTRCGRSHSSSRSRNHSRSHSHSRSHTHAQIRTHAHTQSKTGRAVLCCVVMLCLLAFPLSPYGDTHQTEGWGTWRWKRGAALQTGIGRYRPRSCPWSHNPWVGCRRPMRCRGRFPGRQRSRRRGCWRVAPCRRACS
jgi:hypothetical protein